MVSSLGTPHLPDGFQWRDGRRKGGMMRMDHYKAAEASARKQRKGKKKVGTGSPAK